MESDLTGTLDEAYQRLHDTGPEFDGWLSNHGPMAAEAMVRHGHGDRVHRWLDVYMRRLEEFPRGTGPIGSGWQEALGDPRRIADWTVYFSREVAEQPWRQTLGTWWPRLLPGVAASATHGVIRVGHAVRALMQDGDDADHRAELAHGLAYWAARWQPVPGAAAELPPIVARTAAGEPAEAGPAAADALAAVPRIADQSGGFRNRFPRLDGLPGWPAALAAPQIPASARALQSWLAGLVDAAVFGYLRYGHGEGTMLVHAATAPNAVLRTLPALDEQLWAPSVAASWAAAAAMTAIYAPTAAAQARRPDPPAGAQAAEETFARAVEHGDEHVIKFADTATDVYARTGNSDALAAAVYATQLIGR